MTFKISPYVWETSTTTGTGALTLDGAVTVNALDSTPMSMRTFGSFLANGDTTWYAVRNRSVASEWEEGIGTWNTGGTLTRTTVLKSSNSDALVSFSAGTKDVLSTLPAGAIGEGGRAALAAADAAGLRSAAGITSTLELQAPSISHYFMKLIPFKDPTTGDPFARNWNMVLTSGLNQNPGDPSRPNDTSVTFGYNVKPGGSGVEDPTEPAFGMYMENDFFQGGVRACELHIAHTDTSGFQHRPFSGFWPHAAADNAAAITGIQGSIVYLGDWSHNVRVQFDFNNSVVDFLNSIKLRFNTNNAVTWQQKNAAGTGYLDGVYYTSDNRLRFPAGAAIVGSTPTSGSYANTFMAMQPTSLPSGGIGLDIVMPTVTGNATAVRAQGSYTAGLFASLFNSNSSSTSANCNLDVWTNGAGGGDPMITFAVNGAGNWTLGIDNADSDTFKIEKSWRSLGGSNVGLTIDSNLHSSFGGAVKPKSYTVAALPAAGTAGTGATAYASNGRRAGEGAGAGTGIPVWSDGTNWRTYYDNTVAAA